MSFLSLLYGDFFGFGRLIVRSNPAQVDMQKGEGGEETEEEEE